VGVRFSASVRPGPGDHAVSCTMGTAALPGVMQPGRGDDHPHHLAPRLKIRAAPLLPLWTFVACSRVTFICHVN